MYCLLSNNNDPCYNLATEEYLLRERSENFFLVWISKSAVIVGKHQNTLAEINPLFVHNHNILVTRRLSGGGTVYHDEGNLNFSFITNEEPGKLIDFKRHALPVVAFLEEEGIHAVFGTKNEILAAGLKISGSAGHIYKNRVLHHGTLLFDTNLEYLRAALSKNTQHYKSRAVESNRARVVNCIDFLDIHVPINVFSKRLFDFIRERYGGEDYKLNAEESASIFSLSAKKYSTWEWIYGYSPDYRFEHEFIWDEKTVKIAFNGMHGFIRDFVINTSLLPEESCAHLSQMLNGHRHAWKDLLLTISELKLPGFPGEKTRDFLLPNLF